MGCHMKTTLEIADPLLTEAKALARKERVSLRSLVEQGLKLALAQRRKAQPFKLRDASINGHGLQPEADAYSWEHVRALIYEGQGG